MEKPAVSALIEAARKLWPECSEPGFSVLRMAGALGIDISIESGPQFRDRQGRLVWSSPPRIQIFREKSVVGSIRIREGDEDLLEVWDRFTVAHEIGHWLMLKEFGVESSINRSSLRDEYWTQEALVNAFANALLVPTDSLAEWVSTKGRREPILINDLFSWSNRLRVSLSVVAQQVSELRSKCGFMRLTLVRRVADHRVVLRVDTVVSAKDLILPNKFKHIFNERLMLVLSSKSEGHRLLRGCSLDGRLIQDLFLSWRSVKPRPWAASARETLTGVAPRSYAVSVSEAVAIDVPDDGELF